MLNMLMQKPLTFSLCLTMAFAMMLVPDLAAAQAQGVGTGEQVIADVLCSVVAWFTGSVGKGIATLAIIIIGVGALMGKVSWGMAIIVGIGVAVIFGASNIVSELGGTGTNCV